MNTINPYILLSIGLFFGLLYALVIIFGVRKTRRARRTIQQEAGIVNLPVFHLDRNEPSERETVRCISLTANKFLSPEQQPVDPSEFDVYIAEGTSPRYPDISPGNLLMFEKGTRTLRYAFVIPSLKGYE